MGARSSRARLIIIKNKKIYKLNKTIIEEVKKQRSQVQNEYDQQLNNLDHIIDSLTTITQNSIVMKLLEDSKPKEEPKTENFFLTQLPLEESILKVFKTFHRAYSTKDLADFMLQRGFQTSSKNIIQLFCQYLSKLEKKGYLVRTEDNEWLLKSDYMNYMRRVKADQARELNLELQ